MLLGPPGARDLAVGHVADEDVVEGVAASAAGRPDVLLADELLAFERREPLANHVPRQAAQRDKRSEPEGSADHRRRLKEALLLRRERIQPRRDDALDRLRQRELFQPLETPPVRSRTEESP